MPDKRDIHKAKSHRNSKNKNQQQAARPQAAPAAATVTAVAEPTEAASAPTGKKNKSRR
jgi:hypothetical protein